MRLFIAVTISEEMRDALAAVQDELRRAHARVTWVGRHKFHLTLAFLGETSPEQVDAVAAALAESVAGTEAFRLSLHGIGAFPSLERPRVIWAGIDEGAPVLENLAERIAGRLEPLGFTREKRGFSAHLTIGRVRGPTAHTPLAARIKAHAQDVFGSCPIHSVELMQSILHPDGPEYLCLKSVSLR